MSVKVGELVAGEYFLGPAPHGKGARVARLKGTTALAEGIVRFLCFKPHDFLEPSPGLRG